MAVAKRKLSQNKPDETVQRIMLERGEGEHYRNPELAAEMRKAHR